MTTMAFGLGKPSPGQKQQQQNKNNFVIEDKTGYHDVGDHFSSYLCTCIVNQILFLMKETKDPNLVCIG